MVAQTDAVQLLPRVILGPVLDDDDLEVVGRLDLHYALQTSRQLVYAVRLVVGGDDHRDELGRPRLSSLDNGDTEKVAHNIPWANLDAQVRLRTGNHCHTFQGAVPWSHMSLSRMDSRYVSMGCQKPS